MSPTVCIIILVTGYLPFVRVDLSFRVIKGDIAHPEQYAYIVALVKASAKNENLTARFCSGTAITLRWILTAAHCAVVDAEFVQYGNMSLAPTETVTKSAVLESIIHPNYKDARDIAVHDIAVLRVEPVDIKMFGKISSVHYETLIGVGVQFAGYGLTNINSSVVYNKQVLLIGEGVVSACLDVDNYLADACICVYSKCSNGQYVYFGDSGGPLLFNNKVVGVVSRGRPRLHLSMSTPVSIHLNWIIGVLSSHNEISSRN